MSTSQAVFNADAARFDEAFRKADAIYMIDGEEFIDESKVSPDLVDTWRRFIAYGYANGLMP